MKSEYFRVSLFHRSSSSQWIIVLIHFNYTQIQSIVVISINTDAPDAETEKLLKSIQVLQVIVFCIFDILII